jgi:hypothetical protein
MIALTYVYRSGALDKPAALEKRFSHCSELWFHERWSIRFAPRLSDIMAYVSAKRYHPIPVLTTNIDHS